MSRRGNGGDISSFDMLLDTMCNTFGGIVFIALLLSILVGSTARHAVKAQSSGSPSLAEVEELAEESRLIRECEQLDRALNTPDSKTSPEPSSAAGVVRPLAELQQTNIVLESEMAKLQEHHLQRSEEMARLEESAKSKSTTARDLQVQIERLKDELKQQVAKSSETIRLPRIHAKPGLQACFFAVAGGRFYSISDVAQADTYGDRGYDLQDVSVMSEEGQDIVVIKNGAGQPIIPGCENAGKLAVALQNCDKDSEIISFSVRSDSFYEFNYVKKLFVARGFNYNWHITDGTIQIVLTTEALEAQ